MLVHHLPDSQRLDLEKLLMEFEHLFPDVPTRTGQIYHDVDVGNFDPVKQHPYRINLNLEGCEAYLMM